MLSISSYDFLKDLGSIGGNIYVTRPLKQDHLQVTNNVIKIDIGNTKFCQKINFNNYSNFKSILRSMKNLFTF